MVVQFFWSLLWHIQNQSFILSSPFTLTPIVYFQPLKVWSFFMTSEEFFWDHLCNKFVYNQLFFPHFNLHLNGFCWFMEFISPPLKIKGFLGTTGGRITEVRIDLLLHSLLFICFSFSTRARFLTFHKYFLFTFSRKQLWKCAILIWFLRLYFTSSFSHICDRHNTTENYAIHLQITFGTYAQN